MTQVEQLKVDVAKKAVALEQEFEAHGRFREQAQVQLSQHAQLEVNHKAEIVAAEGQALAAKAIAEKDKAAAGTVMGQGVG